MIVHNNFSQIFGYVQGTALVECKAKDFPLEFFLCFCRCCKAINFSKGLSSTLFLNVILTISYSKCYYTIEKLYLLM